MPEKNSTIRELHNRNRNLWQIVLLLAVLVVVTIILIVTLLYPFVHHSDYEISIYQGLISSRQDSTNTTSAETVSTTEKLTSTQAQKFNFQVTDDQSIWSTDTVIELFETSYRNDEGKITVQSADNGKVVAPGTGGNYTFSVKNASKLNSNYQIWLDTNINVGASGIPIEFRISGSDGWLSGNDGEWLTADELNQAVERKNLYSGKSTEYTLYWRWAFERGEDENDTSYGNVSLGESNVSGGQMNVSQSVSYKVTLHTLAAEGLIGEDVTPTSVPAVTAAPAGINKDTDDADNNSINTDAANRNTTTDSSGSHPGKNAKTGDTTPVEKWLIIIGAAALVICAAAVFRRRKNKKQEDR